MIKLFDTDSTHQAEIIKQMLTKNNITVVLLNKQDSSYLMFGLIELYVKKEEFNQAMDLLKHTENE